MDSLVAFQNKGKNRSVLGQYLQDVTRSRDLDLAPGANVSDSDSTLFDIVDTNLREKRNEKNIKTTAEQLMGSWKFISRRSCHLKYMIGGV